MKRNVILRTAGLVIVLSSFVVHAELMTYEGYDYDAGAFIGGLNGGTGWGGSWTHNGYNDKDNVRTGAALSYTDGTFDLPTVGYGHRIDRSFRSAQRLFGQRHTSGEFWYSMLVRPENGGAIGFRLLDPNGGSSQISVGTGSGQYALSFDGNSDSSTVSGDNSDTQFIVLRMDMGTTTSDGSIHMFINPNMGSEPALGTADAQLLNQDSTQMAFERIFLPGGESSSGPPNRYDEIRLADNFADAFGGVPEPGSLGLLGLSALSLLTRRRRA